MTQSTFPPDFTSEVGKLRNLCNDVEQYVDPENPTADADYLFSDARLNAFLELNNGNIRFAAADVVDAIADNESLVSKKIRTEDLQTDGPAVTNALRLHASSLRAQAKQDIAAEEDAEGMLIVPAHYAVDPLPWGFPQWF